MSIFHLIINYQLIYKLDRHIFVICQHSVYIIFCARSSPGLFLTLVFESKNVKVKVNVEFETLNQIWFDNTDI